VQPIFVVSGLKTNLLGMRAITTLVLAMRIDSTETHDHEKPSQLLQDIFEPIQGPWESVIEFQETVRGS
jgi:hypothetical protein